MLAVIAFIAFWVIVALVLFLLAARPGRGGGLRSGRAGSRTSILMFLVTAAVFGVAIPLLMLTGNHSNASAQVGGTMTLSYNQRIGRQIFAEQCGTCHTLSAANAVGKVGPDLDLVRPSYSLVLHTINNGCLPNGSASSGQSCLGQGVMDANIVTGRAAQEVAAFVSKVAGT